MGSAYFLVLSWERPQRHRKIRDITTTSGRKVYDPVPYIADSSHAAIGPAIDQLYLHLNLIKKVTSHWQSVVF
jgi:hypothetical protein